MCTMELLQLRAVLTWDKKCLFFFEKNHIIIFLKDDKCQKSVLRIGLIAIVKRPVHKIYKKGIEITLWYLDT